MRRSSLLLLAGLFVASIAGADPVPLSLAQARSAALENSPLLRADARSVDIADQYLRENRAAYLPSLGLSVTAAGSQALGARDGVSTANQTARITAGAINAPSVPDRAAAGVVVSQLLTDFGRTDNLVESAKASLGAAQSAFAGSREDVLLRVTENFYKALAGDAAQLVARKTLDQRQTVLDQISELQKNQLKSQLDVNFAEVNVEQAKLLILQTQNQIDGAVAELKRVIGLPGDADYRLVDESGITAPPENLGELIEQALAKQPQLQSLRESVDAARKYAKAQRALAYPTLSLVGAAGTTPVGNGQISENYTAGGINFSLPIYQGGRLDAQYREATLRADRIAEQVKDAELATAKDVRVAWLATRTSYESIAVAEKLRASARSSLDLAQSRYRLGISSIIELNRAELDALDAEIGYVDVLYQYKIALSRLDYHLGRL